MCIPLILFYVISIYVQAFNISVPPEIICDDLNPIHIIPNAKNQSQEGRCPIKVSCNASQVEIGYPIIITISSKENHTFRGFILQAKYRDLPCGMFKAEKGVQLVECSGKGPKTRYYDITKKVSNMVLYLGKELMMSYELVWYSPDYFLGPINFYLSAIIDENKFWVASKNKDLLNVMYDYRYHPEFYTEKVNTTTVGFDFTL